MDHSDLCVHDFFLRLVVREDFELTFDFLPLDGIFSSIPKVKGSPCKASHIEMEQPCNSEAAS